MPATEDMMKREPAPMVPPCAAARMTRATSYPFEIPAGSFTFRDGRAEPLDPDGLDLLTRGRVPVIACGSNQSPEQLARKYDGVAAEVVIPVVRGWLADFDAVFSAHITTYGSVAATLQHRPGTTVALSVLWLTEEQLDRMHGTEAPGVNYAYTRLDRLQLRLDGGPVLTTAWAYTSLHGCLVDDGEEAALAAMPARGRTLPARHQTEMLRRVHGRLAPTMDFDAFVLDNIADHAARRRRIGELRADAAPFAWRHVHVETI
jgi:hypothetical protein